MADYLVFLLLCTLMTYSIECFNDLCRSGAPRPICCVLFFPQFCVFYLHFLPLFSLVFYATHSFKFICNHACILMSNFLYFFLCYFHAHYAVYESCSILCLLNVFYTSICIVFVIIPRFSDCANFTMTCHLSCHDSTCLYCHML